MTEIICTTISAIAGIIVAVLSIHIKRSDDRAERRAELRQKESYLSMKMIDTVMQLSQVSAIALTGGTNNGNVEKAMTAAQESARDYQEFLQAVAAREVGK